jgi:putative transposase
VSTIPKKRGSWDCGYDAGKKVEGRKRHIVVDTTGLLLDVSVHAADIQDRDGAKLVLGKLLGRYPRLRHLWADGGYAGPLKDWAPELGNWILEIVRKDPETKGFAVLPRRWGVERTFAWLSRNRRLSKDDEAWAETSESLVFLAMTALMLRRLAPT